MIYEPPSEILMLIRALLRCEQGRALEIENFIKVCGYKREAMTGKEFRNLVYRIDKMML
jgi:hypothetical protein